MIPIVEFEERSKNGPSMDKEEFDNLVMDTAMEVVEERDLEFDQSAIIQDDETADAVFAAAMDFLEAVGLYNMGTHRVIKWTRDEIADLVDDYKNNPRSMTLGEGAEQFTVAARSEGDPNPPIIWAAGGPLADISQIEPCIMAYKDEHYVKGLLKTSDAPAVDGIVSQAGTATEIYCTTRCVAAQTAALEKAGRVGLFRGNANPTNLGAVLAATGPGMFEPGSFMMGVHIAPEMQLDGSRLSTALACELLGIEPWISAMSMMGGLCGGPEGAAIGAVANALAQMSYAHGKWTSIGTTDMQGAHKDWRTLAAESTAHKAIVRNLRIPTSSVCVESGMVCCHEEAIITGVMVAMMLTTSGGAIDWFTGTSPLTARLHHDVMTNVATMRRDEMNELLNRVLEKKAEIVAAHEGEQLPFPLQLFGNIYDLQTVRPKPEYVAAVQRSIDALRECGVPVSEGLSLD